MILTKLDLHRMRNCNYQYKHENEKVKNSTYDAQAYINVICWP